MYDLVPANFDANRFRLNGPVPLDLLTPAKQLLYGNELSTFVMREAANLKDDLGFGWTGAQSKRFTCKELHRLIAHSAATKEPLPVPDVGADKTILGSIAATLALRYWRSLCKLRLTEACDAASELQCDLTLVAIAEVEEVSPEAVMYLEADLVGSTLLELAGYAQPLDSQQYTLDVMTFGYADAIVLEAERQTESGDVPGGGVVFGLSSVGSSTW